MKCTQQVDELALSLSVVTFNMSRHVYRARYKSTRRTAFVCFLSSNSHDKECLIVLVAEFILGGRATNQSIDIIQALCCVFLKMKVKMHHRAPIHWTCSYQKRTMNNSVTFSTILDKKMKIIN